MYNLSQRNKHINEENEWVMINGLTICYTYLVQLTHSPTLPWHVLRLEYWQELRTAVVNLNTLFFAWRSGSETSEVTLTCWSNNLAGGSLGAFPSTCSGAWKTRSGDFLTVCDTYECTYWHKTVGFLRAKFEIQLTKVCIEACDTAFAECGVNWKGNSGRPHSGPPLGE